MKALQGEGEGPKVLHLAAAHPEAAALNGVLAAHGYRVLVRPPADLAVDRAADPEVALVLLDRDLPGNQALELLARSHRLCPEVPVVLYSARRDFELLREAWHHGAQDFLVRPCAEAVLLDAVAAAVRTLRKARAAARIRRQADRRLADLVLLREIGAAAIREADLQPLFERIVEAIRDALEVDIVSLMLLGEDGRLQIRASQGLPGAVAGTTRVAPGSGVAGYVLATGEAVLVDDIVRDGRFPPSGGGRRYRSGSLLSVPIVGRERVTGVLNVNNKHSGAPFTAADQQLLSAIAHQAALAIENFDLVANLRHQAEALQVANRNLQSQDEARGRLICNLSHELKTPLTSVLGYTDLMLNFRDQLGEGEVRSYLEKVHAESRHLDRLISNMLLLFSLDAGGGRWQPRALHLDIPLADALKGLRDRIVGRALRVAVELDEALPEAWGDPDKIGIMVAALLDNAVKFNRHGGALWVRGEPVAESGGRQLRLRIHNDGSSIPAAAAATIFERFSQLGDIDRNKPAGFGIGLAICKAIVTRLGGHIYLEPECGEGTTIGVVLPAAGQQGKAGHGQG